MMPILLMNIFKNFNEEENYTTVKRTRNKRSPAEPFFRINKMSLSRKDKEHRNKGPEIAAIEE